MVNELVKRRILSSRFYDSEHFGLLVFRFSSFVSIFFSFSFDHVYPFYSITFSLFLLCPYPSRLQEGPQVSRSNAIPVSRHIEEFASFLDG